MNSFDWKDYEETNKLKDFENPFKILNSQVFWYYVSFMFFNWQATHAVMYERK